MGLVLLWASAIVLIALAVVGWLLPQTRRWHSAGVASLCVLCLVGLGTAIVATWTAAVLTEDELYDAAVQVSDRTYGTPGQVTQQRLMALISDEVDEAVFADRVDANATDTSYDVRPSGKDSPTVCVKIEVASGTATSLQESILVVERGSCE